MIYAVRIVPMVVLPWNYVSCLEGLLAQKEENDINWIYLIIKSKYGRKSK